MFERADALIDQLISFKSELDSTLKERDAAFKNLGQNFNAIDGIIARNQEHKKRLSEFKVCVEEWSKAEESEDENKSNDKNTADGQIKELFQEIEEREDEVRKMKRKSENEMIRTLLGHVSMRV